MSMCAGKIACEIYRDKRYCSKSTEENKECECHHAVRLCDVNECGFESVCKGHLKELLRGLSQ